MADVTPDAAGNLLVQRPNLQAPVPKPKAQAARAPPIATKYTPAAAPSVLIAEALPPPAPAPVVATSPPAKASPPVTEQPRMAAKDTLLPTKDQEKEKEKERETDGKLHYANFVPFWFITLILVIIGTLMCPVLGAIGIVFAVLAKLNGVSTFSSDPRLPLAEGCNKIACHLGVGAIIAGFIIIGALVAVLIFLFTTSASSILQDTV